MNPRERSSLSQKLFPAAVGIATLSGLYAGSFHSYPLFHTLIAVFSIIVSFAIIVLAWNTRRVRENHYLLYPGIAFLFTGALELLLTLTYKGFGDPADNISRLRGIG